jgi:hypothetical protein
MVRLLQAGLMVLGALGYIAIIVLTYASAWHPLSHPEWAFIIGGVWLLLLVAVSAVVIVDSVQKVRSRKTRQLATDALVVKLVAIPFFVLNFVLIAILFIGGATMFHFGLMVLWVPAAIGFGLTYPAMLSTSIYSWAAIAQLRREGILKTWQAVLYAILSLSYVTDVAAAVLLFGHARRRPTRALVIVMLSFGLLLAALAIVDSVGRSLTYDDTFGWMLVPGILALLTAIVVSIVLIPALRRESGRLAGTDGVTTEDVMPDRVLGS